MKKFQIVLIVLVIIYTGIMTVGMVDSMAKSKNLDSQRIMRENRQLENEVELRDNMFGKYADSVSDAMLRDFYPDVKNLDSLREHLKEKYEIKLRKDQDGLCY